MNIADDFTEIAKGLRRIQNAAKPRRCDWTLIRAERLYGCTVCGAREGQYGWAPCVDPNDQASKDAFVEYARNAEKEYRAKANAQTATQPNPHANPPTIVPVKAKPVVDFFPVVFCPYCGNFDGHSSWCPDA